MIRKYLSTWVGDGTEQSPREPALCAVFDGNWGSEPGPSGDTVIVVADVSEAEHSAIIDAGFSEVV